MKGQPRYIILTKRELREVMKSVVHETLIDLKLKPSRQLSGRIYRQDMIQILGSERQFNNAVKGGYLKVKKGPGRTSKVWASRDDWERFLKRYVNNEA